MKESVVKEIDIRTIDGFKLGNAEYEKSGCTVVLAKDGAVTGVDIRGGAPASRESGLLNPLAANDGVHAVILSGGSAFGLDTASGAMKYLEERGIGFPAGGFYVPIVCTSCLFDLPVIGSTRRPDAQLGYEACANAEKGIFQTGKHGAGKGATIGKVLGETYVHESGLGTCALAIGDLKVGAVAAVNALGNVINKDGTILAGMKDPKTNEWIDAEEALYTAASDLSEGQNTTIGIVITNAFFSKTACTKIAGLAHDGYARAIRPVHTMFDGDSIYVMSHGTQKADINVVGTLAAEAMERAIRNALKEEQL